MTLIIPTFTNGNPLSASQLNVLSDALSISKAVADRPRVPFRVLDQNATYTGYIYHTYNTLAWRTNSAAGRSIQIDVNSSTVDTLTSADGTSGTIDLTAEGLTVGQVYQVDVTITGDGELRWLAEVYEPSHSAPPTISNGVTLTATNLNDFGDRIDELLDLAQTPPGVFEKKTNSQSSWDRVNDDTLTIDTWYGRHVGDTVTIAGWHQARSVSGSSGTDSMKSKLRLSINGTLVFEHINGEDFATDGGGNNLPGFNTATKAIVTRTGGGSGRNWIWSELNGTFDISGLSLTLGNYYSWVVTQRGDGTDKSMDLKCIIKTLADGVASAATWSAPKQWTRHNQDVSAANLNLYGTGINRLYPGSGSENAPLYYQNMVQFTWAGETSRFITHAKKFLVYRPDGVGTPQIFINQVAPYALKTQTGTQYVDLEQVPYLNYGTRYQIDDVNYAVEVDSVEQLQP